MLAVTRTSTSVIGSLEQEGWGGEDRWNLPEMSVPLGAFVNYSLRPLLLKREQKIVKAPSGGLSRKEEE